MNALDNYRRELFSSLTPGSFYRINHPVLSVGDTQLDCNTIYGKTLERPDNGFVMAKGFSQSCPDGEVGHMSLSSISTLLTPADFSEARDAGWPILKRD